MISNSNSLRRERDAQSKPRRSTSRHFWFRAVPRTNRTPTTVNTHNHSATSSTTEPPACVPSLPWQCFCADASLGERTDVASPDECAPLLGLLFTQHEAQQGISLFADMPQSLLVSTGLLTRDHPHVCADLLATLKSSWSSDDQHVGQCRKRTDTGMSHQPHRLGSLPSFPFGLAYG